MKAVVLKPIMWSSNNWVRPSGYPSTSGYAHEHGFGHEEWNNNPNWVWRGYRIFHTESTARLREFSKDGELGIIMTASHGGRQYALGVAVGVFDHDVKTDMQVIADELGVHALGDEVWSVPHVQRCFGGNRAKFNRFWDDQYVWIRWRCEKGNYLWFKEPVLLDPKRISGKSRLANMHGVFQPIHPEVAIDIIGASVPKSRRRILDWLRTGPFDSTITPERSKGLKPSRRWKSGGPANRPTDRAFAYWVQGNRVVEPRHHILQALFVKHLRDEGVSYEENKQCVDVRYALGGSTVFCEIKPTDNLPPALAVRIAVGQLLEYRFRLNGDAQLEIVLGGEPDGRTKAFVKSLGIRLTYRTKDGKSFKTLDA